MQDVNVPAFQDSRVSRRGFLAASAAVAAASGLPRTALLSAAQPTAAKVIVGGHPWVYVATQPNYDITPVLP